MTKLTLVVIDQREVFCKTLVEACRQVEVGGHYFHGDESLDYYLRDINPDVILWGDVSADAPALTDLKCLLELKTKHILLPKNADFFTKLIRNNIGIDNSTIIEVWPTEILAPRDFLQSLLLS